MPTKNEFDVFCYIDDDCKKIKLGGCELKVEKKDVQELQSLLQSLFQSLETCEVASFEADAKITIVRDSELHDMLMLLKTLGEAVSEKV